MSDDDARKSKSGQHFGRRTMGAILAAAAVMGCTPPISARAQLVRPGTATRPASRAPGNTGAVVMPAPMPCTDREGDIAGLLLEGTGAPAGTVTVFGQAFRPGDVPGGTRLAARLATGQAIPVQFDVLRRHADGSARFGLVSLAPPALGTGRLADVVLSRQTAGEEQPNPLDLAAALEGRQILVELTLEGSGQPWRADLAALLRATPPATRWQSGPLAVQARLALPVPAGGVTSLRLVADVTARADGTLWADIWLRNDIAMQPGGGEVVYAVRIAIDDREALSATVARHWQYAGWGRLLSGAPGGRLAPEPPRVRHDPVYLAEAGAALPYDLTTGVDEALFTRMTRTMADPAWATPLAPRGTETNMGAPGARPDIGQTTLWAAAWVITGDARAAAYVIGQAESASSIPWCFWDPHGGADRQGGWLDVRRWPLFWADPRGGRPPRTLLQPYAINTLWKRSPVPSHQPGLSYVPYVLTGRRAFLDNLLAQAAWNVTNVWPAARRTLGASGAIQDVNVVKNRQVRSAAWSMRQLDEAAWIAPENDPNLPYIEEVTAANWGWLRAQIPDWTTRQGELHGYIQPLNFGYGPNLGPWQQDYFASTAAMAALRGREDARVFLGWMRNFIVGRFFATEHGFTRNDGVSYTLALFPLPVPIAPAPPGQPFTTWAQMASNSRERGIANNDGWKTSNGEYARLAMLSLALTDRALGDERAREAFTWLAGSNAPYTSLQVFSRIPNHNVAPRDLPRVPGRAPRCTATSRG